MRHFQKFCLKGLLKERALWGKIDVTQNGVEILIVTVLVYREELS